MIDSTARAMFPGFDHPISVVSYMISQTDRKKDMYTDRQIDRQTHIDTSGTAAYPPPLIEGTRKS